MGDLSEADKDALCTDTDPENSVNRPAGEPCDCPVCQSEREGHPQNGVTLEMSAITLGWRFPKGLKGWLGRKCLSLAMGKLDAKPDIQQLREEQIPRDIRDKLAAEAMTRMPNIVMGQRPRGGGMVS
jgi:hypothetical protein